MNKILLTCCILFSCSVTYAQWTWLSPKPSGITNRKVHFTSQDTGYIFNEFAELIRTTNAGQSWAVVNTLTNTVTINIKGSTWLGAAGFG
ncbi:MAG: hypothetical protein WCF67_15930, partial [Chitinophagaceae bacterium]